MLKPDPWDPQFNRALGEADEVLRNLPWDMSQKMG